MMWSVINLFSAALLAIGISFGSVSGIIEIEPTDDFYLVHVPINYVSGAVSGMVIVGSWEHLVPEWVVTETIKHEAGHLIQQQIYGNDYYQLVAIPSIISAGFYAAGIISMDTYYDLPWEREADELGGIP